MARDVAYSHAEKEIEKIAYKKQKHLDLSVAWNAPDYEWLSELPESLKKWADKNPEKFIKNIKHVQNLLRK